LISGRHRSQPVGDLRNFTGMLFCFCLLCHHCIPISLPMPRGNIINLMFP
jgi:hypothetical protein